MERDHFDRLTLTLAGATTRRRFGSLLLTLGIGAGAAFDPLRPAESDARRKNKRRKKRNHKKNDKPKSPPADPSSTCGVCPGGLVCDNGQCVDPNCYPDCQGKTCGDDGCGGSCGSCGQFAACQNGICEPLCFPDCTGRECGSDGCGGSCGECPSGIPCEVLSGNCLL